MQKGKYSKARRKELAFIAGEIILSPAVVRMASLREIVQAVDTHVMSATNDGLSLKEASAPTQERTSEHVCSHGQKFCVISKLNLPSIIVLTTGEK
jgi:hypothetical protein